MDERLRKLEEIVDRCETAARRLAARESALRQAARETVDELDRLLNDDPPVLPHPKGRDNG